MKLTITINTENAAFEESVGGEVSRILEKLANALSDWPGANELRIGLYDVNGNRVGECKAEEE